MQIMLSGLQQKTVWDGWLSAEIRANYFADLCHRYQAMQRTATLSTLIASSGATATILAAMPADLHWVRLVLAMLTTALSLWAFVMNYHRRATDCADLHFRWNRLSISYRALWTNMYVANAGRQLAELEERDAELSKTSTGYPNKKRLMVKWQQHVESHHPTVAATA